MGQVEGKVAIVTGGALGIGAACAATLAREGAKVVITDIDDAGAQAVVGKIVAARGEAICLHQDVSIEEDWPRVIEATERRFGQAVSRRRIDQRFAAARNKRPGGPTDRNMPRRRPPDR